MLVTTGAVAVVAHAVADGLSWEAAFVLGTILAPTDPAAAGGDVQPHAGTRPRPERQEAG